MRPPVLYPVQVLQDHLSKLAVALQTCLAEPGHKAVHRLRTETRRVEALLLLLNSMPELPNHRKEGASVRKSLTRLRRAAGQVRDLDVHQKMLDALVAGAHQEAVHARPPVRKRASAKDRLPVPPTNQESLSATVEPADTVGRAAAKLREALGEERETAAKTLQEVLDRQQHKLAHRTKALLRCLEPAQGLALSAPKLLREARALLTRDERFRTRAIADLGTHDLHAVRKSAKKARYLTELLPGDALLGQAALGFERLQEAGGQWHDALQLAHAARQRFGKAHELTSTFRTERDEKLEAYKRMLLAGAAKRQAREDTPPATALLEPA